MVGTLESRKRSATIMEDHADVPGEAHTAKFRRLTREHAVSRYLVYWPAGAQRAGVDWELGILASWLVEGVGPDVRLLVEAEAGTVSGDRFTCKEPGHRTTYYEDLLNLGCPIVEWESYDALWRALLAHSLP